MRPKDVAKLLGIDRTKLRDYERKFYVFTPEKQRGEKEVVDYTETDIRNLKRLVLLNRSTLTCSDIRDVQSGALTLQQAFEAREQAILKAYEEKLASLQMARRIAATGATYDNLDVERWWADMQDEIQNGTRYCMEDDDPQVLVQPVECPHCGAITTVDLEDYGADPDFESSGREDDMGPAMIYHFDTQEPCQCSACTKRFTIHGWLREYPIGAYDSDGIYTKPYEEED